MSASRLQKLVSRKRRIQYRQRERAWVPQDRPTLAASILHYELAERVRGLGPSGIGALHHLARRAGFKSLLLRGDPDFSQTAHLDRWDTAGVRFLFGLNAMRNLIDIAENLPQSAWKKLARPAKYDVQTTPRQRPANVRERIVVAQGYRNIKLQREHVATFAYRPTACRKTYRVVVLRKDLAIEQG